MADAANMQYYTGGPNGAKPLRLDEQALCCGTCCTCNGRPCCTRRGWGTCFILLAVILQILTLLGAGFREPWLVVNRDVQLSNDNSKNASQYDYIGFDGKLIRSEACIYAVDPQRPWSTDGNSIGRCLYYDRSVAPIDLSAAKLDYTRPKADVPGRSIVGILAGLATVLPFMLLGPHWCLCESKLGQKATRTRVLLAGLALGALSFSCYYGAVTAFQSTVFDSLQDYLDSQSLSGGRGYYRYDPYNRPRNSPAYGVYAYTGPGLGLVLAGAIIGTVSWSIVLLWALCCGWRAVAVHTADAGAAGGMPGGAAAGTTVAGVNPINSGAPRYDGVPTAIPVQPGAPYGGAGGYPTAPAPGAGYGGGYGQYGYGGGYPQQAPPGYPGAPPAGGYYPSAGYSAPAPGTAWYGAPQGAGQGQGQGQGAPNAGYSTAGYPAQPQPSGYGYPAQPGGYGAGYYPPPPGATTLASLPPGKSL